MRILIYGFGPYLHFKDNVTQKILRKLPRRTWLKKVVFPVKFNRTQFLQTVKAHSPDVILGLGQCSAGQRLRIERRAVNRRRSGKKQKARPIVPGGARQLSTDLKLTGGGWARSSHNAGEYVCNFSMYVILDELRRRRLSLRYGFIHIPHGYDPGKAVRFLITALENIRAAA